jgi:DNA polymerase III subunit delta
MRVAYHNFETHLRTNLRKLYLISGKETILIQEIITLIRQKALQKGFSPSRHHIDASFKWDQFTSSCLNRTLFSQKQLIQLNFNSAPSKSAGKWIAHYLQHPNPDQIVLIQIGTLDVQAKQNLSLALILKHGIFVPVYTLNPQETTRWIQKKSQALNLDLDDQMITLIQTATEGNLCACSQVLNQLHLAQLSGPITLAQVRAGLNDQSHFDLFKLNDALLKGNLSRCLRILLRLRQEGLDPILVLWLMIRLLRQMITASNQPNDISLRHTQNRWMQLLRYAHRIDAILKGAQPGSAWDEFQRLSGWICGIPCL